MNARHRARLRDIIEAIDQIDQLLEGRDLADLTSNKIFRAAFERFLEIVSEASRHLPADLKDGAPETPWRRIADLGNHLRHAYQTVDIEILWALYRKGELTSLRAVARELMNRSGSGQTSD